MRYLSTSICILAFAFFPMGCNSRDLILEIKAEPDAIQVAPEVLAAKEKLATPRFSIRFGETEFREGLIMVPATPSKNQVYVSPEWILDETHVLTVTPNISKSNLDGSIAQVFLTFTDNGAERMSKATEDFEGKRLIMILDGAVLFEAIAKNHMGKYIVVEPLSEVEANVMAFQIRESMRSAGLEKPFSLTAIALITLCALVPIALIAYVFKR